LNHTHNLESKIRVAEDRLAVLDDMGKVQNLEEDEVSELHVLSADIIAFSKLYASMQWQKSRIN